MLTQLATYLKRDSIITFQVALAEDPEHIFVTVHPHRGEFPPVRFVGTPAELDSATNADITFGARDVVETAAVEPQTTSIPEEQAKSPLPPEPATEASVETPVLPEPQSAVERLRAQLKALEGQLA